jgi:hypothetical protein
MEEAEMIASEKKKSKKSPFVLPDYNEAYQEIEIK